MHEVFRSMTKVGLFISIGFLSLAAESPQSAIPPFLGEKVWTVPAWVTIRATCYTTDGKSCSGVNNRYARDSLVGSAAVPYWIPLGSLIKIKTKDGDRTYLAVDQGRDVESRKAARKGKVDRSIPVIDFCAPHQAWPDQTVVEIFQYTGTTPYKDLTTDQKQQTLTYAQRFIHSQ